MNDRGVYCGPRITGVQWTLTCDSPKNEIPAFQTVHCPLLIQRLSTKMMVPHFEGYQDNLPKADLEI